jgi:hypothetical protein
MRNYKLFFCYDVRYYRKNPFVGGLAQYAMAATMAFGCHWSDTHRLRNGCRHTILCIYGRSEGESLFRSPKSVFAGFHFPDQL